VKKLATGVGVVIAFALLTAAVGAIAYGVIEDPAVVGPLAAAAVAISVAVYQRRWEKKQELERIHRVEMSPIYERLIEVIKSLPEFVELPESEQQAFFRETSSALLLHGPSPVVQAWVAWNRALPIQPFSVPLVAQEDLLFAIRADLGHDNSNLKPGELLRLFVNEEENEEDRAVWTEIKTRQIGPSRDVSAQ
jgi:hypothetical protein